MIIIYENDNHYQQIEYKNIIINNINSEPNQIKSKEKRNSFFNKYSIYKYNLNITNNIDIIKIIKYL